MILAAIAVTQGPRLASSSVLSAVSFLPLAVSLAYGLPGSVYLVSSLPLLLGIVSEERQAWSSVRSGIAFATLLTALGAVWISNQYLVLQSGWDTLPATLAAATVFYLIYSLGLAIPSGGSDGSRHPEAVERGVLPQRTGMAADSGCFGVVSLLTEGASLLERAFGSVLFLVGVVCPEPVSLRLWIGGGAYSVREQDLAVQTAVETLTAVTGAKNHDSPAATRQLRSLARATAKKCACSEEEVHTLELAAVLHDFGKVGVPDHILMKPGALTSREFSQVCIPRLSRGGDLAGGQVPEAVWEVVLHHREHWDGSGYPDGLKGPESSRLARILTIVDSFHALVNDRPFRRPSTRIRQWI